MVAIVHASPATRTHRVSFGDLQTEAAFQNELEWRGVQFAPILKQGPVNHMPRWLEGAKIERHQCRLQQEALALVNDIKRSTMVLHILFD